MDDMRVQLRERVFGPFMSRIEKEKQRQGRNKETTVNHSYINSGKYKKKFDQISNSPRLSRLLYQIAKRALNHRSGTKYEDMYWIDLDTLENEAQILALSEIQQHFDVEFKEVME